MDGCLVFLYTSWSIEIPNLLRILDISDFKIKGVFDVCHFPANCWLEEFVIMWLLHFYVAAIGTRRYIMHMDHCFISYLDSLTQPSIFYFSDLCPQVWQKLACILSFSKTDVDTFSAFGITVFKLKGLLDYAIL